MCMYGTRCLSSGNFLNQNSHSAKEFNPFRNLLAFALHRIGSIKLCDTFRCECTCKTRTKSDFTILFQQIGALNRIKCRFSSKLLRTSSQSKLNQHQKLSSILRLKDEHKVAWKLIYANNLAHLISIIVNSVITMSGGCNAKGFQSYQVENFFKIFKKDRDSARERDTHTGSHSIVSNKK